MKLKVLFALLATFSNLENIQQESSIEDVRLSVRNTFGCA